MVVYILCNRHEHVYLLLRTVMKWNEISFFFVFGVKLSILHKMKLYVNHFDQEKEKNSILFYFFVDHKVQLKIIFLHFISIEMN
jgi:hypothetical protein